MSLVFSIKINSFDDLSRANLADLYYSINVRYLLSRMLLLLDIFGRVSGDKGPGIDDDLAVLENNLSLHPRLDLPRCGNLLFLTSLPFL